MTSIISALTKNRVIGKDGDMPWDIPEDLKRFRKITKGHPAIYGRKTYKSMGRLLPGRLNIILTRQAKLKVDGAEVFNNLEDAIDLAKSKDREEVFIIGGEKVYELALENNLVDKMYLTHINFETEGDAFFPEFDASDWEIVKRQKSSNENFEYEFVDYLRL